jgi:hypothetical protein
MAIGVRKKKKINAIIIGLTIIPKINPKFIHSLFNGVKISDLKNVISEKVNEMITEI